MESNFLKNRDIQNAALVLLRYKATQQMCEGKTTCILTESDVNEILTVAGLPIITENEFKTKEVEVI